MSEMMPGNLENQLSEERAKNAKLRELLMEWSNMFGNHALGGPVQGKELMERTRGVLE